MSKSFVLGVGSVNVDLFHKMDSSSVKFSGTAVDISHVKGMTLPSKSFLGNKNIASQLAAAGIKCPPGQEEAFVLTMEGPFQQMTGGKGANAAAAAGQTWNCEFVCNFGAESKKENAELLADLTKYGNVNTQRSQLVAGASGTAYILLYPDNDNAIVLIGGANQAWPSTRLLESNPKLHEAIKESVAVMLQREIPDYVNLEVARAASHSGKPVFMDVGGSDAPLDDKLMPFISVIAPNESELTFISGVETTANGEIKTALIRDAVSELKRKFAASGNKGIEVMVTLGTKGAMYFSPDWDKSGVEDATGLLPHECRSACLSTTQGVADTTGAGDCFRGSYVAARYGEGKSIIQAMLWAAAASSISVEVKGAMPAMPSRAAIQKRLDDETAKRGAGCGTSRLVAKSAL